MDMVRSKISITLDPDLLKWIDEQVRTKVEFRDRSHLIELVLTRYRENLEKFTQRS